MPEKPANDPSDVPTGAEGVADQAEAKKRFRYGSLVLFFVGFAVFAYAADQLTKLLVTSTMEYGQSIPVLPPFLRWYYITNPGAAFSFGTDFTPVFTVIVALVSVVIIVAIRKVGSAWWAIGLGMVLGGALGNLTDRLFRPPAFGLGEVVDFISVPNFAVFNMADCGVVGGVIVICLCMLFGVPFRGGPRRKSGDEDSAAQSAAPNDA